jgi:predicted short-subunit dehydrogenase-like oxidoreductase (DUF2520 family)
MMRFPHRLSLALALALIACSATAHSQERARQLAAVRGEVVSKKTPNKGMLLLTIRPAKDYAEVTVLARDNDLVGNVVARESGADLLGLLADDSRDDETITAAELNEGDVVSIIYDPAAQNRALEIYLH